MSIKSLSTDFVCAVLKEKHLIDDAVIQEIKQRENEYRELLHKKNRANDSEQITGVDVISAMELHTSTKPDQVLSEELIMRTLASHWKLSFLRIDLAKLKPHLATSKVSEPFATKHLTIPISISKRMLFVAVVNPLDVEALDTLRSVSNLKIRSVISTKTDILKAIETCYKLPKRVEAEEKDLHAFHSSISAAKEELSANSIAAESVPMDEEQDEDKYIVNAVNLLLNYAFKQRTSEVHIEPKQQYSTIRFRIDGILSDVKRIPLEIYLSILRRLKALAGMNISERRKPQDGRIRFTFHNRDIHLQVSTIPVAFGEKVMLRILCVIHGCS